MKIALSPSCPQEITLLMLPLMVSSLIPAKSLRSNVNRVEEDLLLSSQDSYFALCTSSTRRKALLVSPLSHLCSFVPSSSGLQKDNDLHKGKAYSDKSS
jgi:hypothetical protein